MATSLRHCHEEVHPHKGLLPPLRELFLDVQVNKLINDYLFSSSADERSPPLHVSGNGSVEFKENNALPVLPALSHHAAHMITFSACNAPCMKSSRPLHDHHRQPPHEAHYAQTLTRASNGEQILDSDILQSCDPIIKVKEQFSQCSKTPSDVSLVMASTIQNEGGRVACLSRVDTFPCTSKGESQMGVPFKVDMEMKVSSKKPPLPPKLSNLHPSKLDPSFKRCFSDMGTVSPCSRRSKLEKRRKSASPASGNTSLWALLFTFCFLVIMIGQGFWSQRSDGLAEFITNAPLPVEEFRNPSLEKEAKEFQNEGVGRAGVAVPKRVAELAMSSSDDSSYSEDENCYSDGVSYDGAEDDVDEDDGYEDECASHDDGDDSVMQEDGEAEELGYGEEDGVEDDGDDEGYGIEDEGEESDAADEYYWEGGEHEQEEDSEDDSGDSEDSEDYDVEPVKLGFHDMLSYGHKPWDPDYREEKKSLEDAFTRAERKAASDSARAGRPRTSNKEASSNKKGKPSS